MNPLSLVNNISGLPTPVKVVAGVFAAGTVVAAIGFLLGDSPNRNMAMIIVAVGMVFVFLLYMLFRAIVNWSRKRKSNPLSQGIAGNAAAAPQGISEPARRARLDDLRRNFEQGVEKFRAAGKNLYSVPWYVLVGEPGSGKTEAIRHCNVGFPPGLQDQLQGAGGTLNMNWWFTNSAIILDTAGRLMFEEVAPGSTNEWAEFLKLLKQNRPNCPINGMLLVIPVDTLIKDSTEQIEKKSGKIAQQFEQIQRMLGVRFPVFVIITKCDLLNGFREFFDDLNDPQLQHQIMGWSNPAALDERFDPGLVTNHLETVKTRLFERRANLLLDPVHTEDAQARRIEQVDALYALPDSLTKIGPRLRRYLETIFVAGEWSPKPLFLRGIYFTSSMTEGAALDAELAEALGVPVDSLPGGAIFRKDRAYFLRDLFLEKVFREKGLVTRATNADKQQTTRRLVVMGFGFLAVATLFVITYLSSRALESSIGTQRNWWDAAAKLDLGDIQIINTKRDNAYFNDTAITVGGKQVSLAQLFGDNLQQVKEPIHIPLVFRPMRFLASDVNEKRRVAYRKLYERTVLRPVLGVVRTNMQSDVADLSKLTPALAQLMKIEFAKATKKLPPTPAGESKWADLGPMFALIYASPEASENLNKFAKDQETLQKVQDWIYTAEAGGESAWPDTLAGSTASTEAIKAGVAATKKYWLAQTSDTGPALANVQKVREALITFRDAEKTLSVASKGQTIARLTAYRSYRDEVWRRQIDILRASSKAATEAWAAASNGRSDESLKKIYDDTKKRALDDAQKAFDALLALTPEAPPAPDAKPDPSYLALMDARRELEDAKKAVIGSTSKATLDDLAALDAAYFGRPIRGLNGANNWRFEVHSQLYELADKMVIKDEAAVALTGSLPTAFGQVEKEYGDAVATVRQPLFLGGEALVQAGDIAQFTIEASGKAKKFLMADGALKEMPDTAEKWEKTVQAAAVKAGPSDSLRRPTVPLVTFIKDEKLADDEKTFSPLYAPDVAGEVTEKLDTITRVTTANDASAKILDPTDLSTRAAAAKKGFTAYRDKYIEYWRDTAREQLRFNFAKFSDFGGALTNVTDVGINGSLDDYGKKMSAALERIGAMEDAAAIKAARVNPEECKTMLARWNEVGPDARQARRIILGVEAATFRNEYTVATSRISDSFRAHYWRNLPVAALKVLAVESRKDIDESLATLAKYERFPLAPPADKKDDLPQADVVLARAALEKVRGASFVATASGPPRLIGQGANTTIADIDTVLVSLRGTDLFRDRQDYFDKLDKFLIGLPANDKPLTVTLSVDKKKLAAGGDVISNRFSFMPITQGDKALKIANLISTTTADEAVVEYAGGDLKFVFQEVPNGPALQPETFSGPWAVFRLIKSPNVKSVTRDGNKWSVEYTITTADRRSYSLWLLLEFKQPIPDLKDWPVPPGK